LVESSRLGQGCNFTAGVETDEQGHIDHNIRKKQAMSLKDLKKFALKKGVEPKGSKTEIIRAIQDA
jgi:hypothetical protein